MRRNFLQFALFVSVITLAVVFINPSVLHAGSVGLPDYLRPDSLPRVSGIDEPSAEAQTQLLIGKVINWIFGIVGLIAVWAVVNNAFWLVVAVGKGETIDQRKKALFWAVGGLILLILSYVIIQMVVKFIINVAEDVPPPSP